MRRIKFLGLPAAVVLLAIGLALGCSNGSTGDGSSDDLRTSIYKQTINSKVVEIEFSNRKLSAAARTAAGPETGDNYVIRLDGETISFGKVQLESGSYLTFIQSDGEKFYGSLSNGKLSVVVPYKDGTLGVTGATLDGIPVTSGGGKGGGSGGQGQGSSGEDKAKAEAEAAAKALADELNKALGGDYVTVSSGDATVVVTIEDVTLEDDLELPDGVTFRVKNGHTLDLDGHDLSGGGTVEVSGGGTVKATDRQVNDGLDVLMEFQAGSSFKTETTIVIGDDIYNDDDSGGALVGPMFTIGSGSIEINGGTITITNDSTVSIPGTTNITGELAVNGSLDVADGKKLIIADEDSLSFGKDGVLALGENSVLEVGDEKIAGASTDNPVFVVGSGAKLEMSEAGFTITGGTVTLIGGAAPADPYVLTVPIIVGTGGTLAIGSLNITTNDKLSVATGGDIGGSGTIDGDTISDWLSDNREAAADVEITAITITLPEEPGAVVAANTLNAIVESVTGGTAAASDVTVTMAWYDETGSADVALTDNIGTGSANEYTITVTLTPNAGFVFASDIVSGGSVTVNKHATDGGGTATLKTPAALDGDGKITFAYTLNTTF